MHTRERECGCKQMWMPHQGKAATEHSEQVALKAAAKVPHPSGNLSTLLPLSNSSSARAQLEIAVDTETERAFHCRGPRGLMMALPRANTRSLCEFEEEQARLDRKFPKEWILSLTQLNALELPRKKPKIATESYSEFLVEVR